MLEQQSSSTGHVILTQPFSSENSAPLPCWIYINVTRLLKPQGFSLASVCLISSSRTVEIYTEEEEYISTSKGVLQETTLVQVFCTKISKNAAYLIKFFSNTMCLMSLIIHHLNFSVKNELTVATLI